MFAADTTNVVLGIGEATSLEESSELNVMIYVIVRIIYIYIDIYIYMYLPRKSKDQTLPLGSRESFTWIILKTILCLVLHFQGLFIFIYIYIHTPGKMVF